MELIHAHLNSRLDPPSGSEEHPLLHPASWEQLKEELRRLYLEEDWTLEKTMYHMAQGGFNQSKEQYKKKFKKWGFKKNVRQRDVVAMVQVRAEREALGKATEFEVKGKWFNLDARLQANPLTEHDMESSDGIISESIRVYTPLPACVEDPVRVESPPPATPVDPTTLRRRDSQVLRAALLECASVLKFVGKSVGGKDGRSDDSPLIEAASSLALGLALNSRGHFNHGEPKCRHAFKTLGLLAQDPHLDNLMYFLLVSMEWHWPDHRVSELMWEQLAELPHSGSEPSRTVHDLFRKVHGYIEAHGAGAYLDAMEACIPDFLKHMSEKGHPISTWDLMEWTQDMALYSHKDDGTTTRALSIVVKCPQIVNTDGQSDPGWRILGELFVAISEQGFGHTNVPNIANRLLVLTAEDDLERDSSYFCFHACSALAMYYKKRWDQRTKSRHQGILDALHFLRRAEVDAAKCHSLAPAALLENWFVMENWLREIGSDKEADAVHSHWLEWVKSL